ncbi:MAG: hypothetical protein ACOX7N_10630 [Lawsonibacter sp.]
MKRKKLFLACFACIGVLFFVACAKSPETSTDSAVPETSVETGHTAEPGESSSKIDPEGIDPEQEYEYPSEDAGPLQEESRLGYSMTYDPTVFTLDDTGESLDIYTYHTSEVLDGPAYISIAAYPDMDAKTLADGIALQSGQDSVAPQITYFGADGLDTQCVSYEEEVNGVTQVHAFYAVPKGEGSLLVEITGYVDMPQQIQAKFEEMTGTFTLS